jgi:hypothetical protein
MGRKVNAMKVYATTLFHNSPKWKQLGVIDLVPVLVGGWKNRSSL